ncbi:MAG: hypothetical protein JNM04_06110 [Chthonomonas sp.]|nr:hypothetical protein [Chthonomonas sp.]
MSQAFHQHYFKYNGHIDPDHVFGLFDNEYNGASVPSDGHIFEEEH